jgi:hypothetical protein
VLAITSRLAAGSFEITKLQQSNDAWPGSGKIQGRSRAQSAQVIGTAR